MGRSAELQLDELGQAIPETVRAPLLVLDNLETALEALGRHSLKIVELPQAQAGS